jgi:hypothetical protein
VFDQHTARSERPAVGRRLEAAIIPAVEVKGSVSVRQVGAFGWRLAGCNVVGCGRLDTCVAWAVASCIQARWRLTGWGGADFELCRGQGPGPRWLPKRIECDSELYLRCYVTVILGAVVFSQFGLWK